MYNIYLIGMGSLHRIDCGRHKRIQWKRRAKLGGA